MNALVICVAAATMGLDVGWQPTENGELEYIIQIEPELLDTLRDGYDIRSEIPPTLINVRRCRITVNNATLPRVAPEPPANETAAAEGSLRFPGQPHSGNQDSSSAQQPVENETESPAPFTPDTRTRPLFSKVDELQKLSQPKSEPGRAEDTTSTVEASHKVPVLNNDTLAADSAKPWLPLTVALLGLFLSVGGNIYLAWVAQGARVRYRLLVEQMRGPTAN